MNTHSEEIARAYLDSSLTLKQVAGQYKITHQMVNLHVKAFDPDKAMRRKRLLRIEDERKAKEEAAKAKALEGLPDCVVCSKPVSSPHRRTCGHECAVALSKARHRISDEHALTHRRNLARSILANPQKYPNRQEWARQMLSDNPPPKNRPYPTFENSQASRALDLAKS